MKNDRKCEETIRQSAPSPHQPLRPLQYGFSSLQKKDEKLTCPHFAGGLAKTFRKKECNNTAKVTGKLSYKSITKAKNTEKCTKTKLPMFLSIIQTEKQVKS